MLVLVADRDCGDEVSRLVWLGAAVIALATAAALGYIWGEAHGHERGWRSAQRWRD